MSEQYYQREDALSETPERAIENWTAQSNSLAHVVPEVAQRLEESGAALGELYAKAEASGDERAMQIISTSWTHMETIANQTVQMDATRQAAAAAIQTIDDERQRLADELGGLEKAISEGDENHPLLAGYAETIRADASEYLMEEAIQDAYEYVADSTYDNFQTNLKFATGCEWGQISRFIEVLQGDVELSPLQSEKLKEFIESLGEETD